MRRYATALAVTAVLGAGGFAAASIASGGGLASVSRTATTSTTGHKQLLCHHTHSKNHPFHTISVDSHAVPAHLKHGDTLGACPASQPTASKNKNKHKNKTSAGTHGSSGSHGAHGNGNGNGKGNGKK
jgi:hypothetical protein